MVPSLLILTVGTGTAGKHSEVAQGLANTIRQVRPRKVWLVPSASEKSTPVAAPIRESVADLDCFTPSAIAALPTNCSAMARFAVLSCEVLSAG